MSAAVTALPGYALLAESLLHTGPFRVLATFVALNTVMYATLAVLKVLPKGYGLWPHGGRDRRTESRSIHPDPPERDG